MTSFFCLSGSESVQVFVDCLYM